MLQIRRIESSIRRDFAWTYGFFACLTKIQRGLNRSIRRVRSEFFASVRHISTVTPHLAFCSNKFKISESEREAEKKRIDRFASCISCVTFSRESRGERRIHGRLSL
jgi:hypothetical protein